MNKVLPLFAFSILLLVPTGISNVSASNVIFDDSPPAGTIVIGQVPTIIRADDFVLAESSFLTDVHFWIIDEDDGFDNQVEYFVYDNTAIDDDLQNLIASGIGQNVMSMPAPLVCNNCKEVWIDLQSPILLEANEIYWIGLRLPFSSLSPLRGLVSDNTPDGFAQRGSPNGVDWVTNTGLDIPMILTGNNRVVGGEFLPIETTSLVLAGTQTSLLWVLPIIFASASFYLLKSRINK